MEELKIKLETEKAEKISIFINNTFIYNFFDFSNALDSIYDFKSLLELKELMIYLKSVIDEELDKTI